MEGVSFITPMQLWSMGKMGGLLDLLQLLEVLLMILFELIYHLGQLFL